MTGSVTCRMISACRETFLQCARSVEMVSGSPFFKFGRKYHGHDRLLKLIDDLHSPSLQVRCASRQAAHHHHTIRELHGSQMCS
jgi:hypothetical protein